MEGMTSTPEFTTRRATFQDFRAVLDIRENIYNGMDYMKAMFFYFLQTNSHVMYVLEYRGKVIALLNCHLHPEKNVVTFKSGRIHPSFEGKGLVFDSGPLQQMFKKEYPGVDTTIRYSVLKPSIMRHISQCEIIHQWNVLNFRTTVKHMQSRMTVCSSLLNPPQLHQPVELSYAQSIQMLNGKGGYELERLLSSYANGYIPITHSLRPVKINQTGIRDIFQFSSKVLSSYGRVSDEDSPRGAPPISQQLQRLHQDQGEGKKLEDNNLTLTAFSYATCMQLGNQPKYDGVYAVFFYGNQKNEFLQHVYSHLCHLANVFRGSIVLCLHYPKTIDDDDWGDRFSQAFNIGEYENCEFAGYISKI